MSKKIFNAIVVVALIAFAATSCKYKEQWEQVNVNNEFTMEVPSWMEKTSELKEGAMFQYRNRFRSVYAIVVKEKADAVPQDFGAYVSANITVLKNVLTNPVLSDSSVVELDKLSGIRAEVYGNMGEEKIFYTHYTLKGDKGFNYQICAWTRGEDRKLKYNNDINRIIASFKRL
jgi:hypothetical protein